MSKRAIETGRTIYNLSTGNKKITQKYDEIINKKKKEADEKRMRSLSFTPFVNSPYAIVGDETKRNIAYHKKNPNAQYKSSMQLVLESRKLRNKTDNEEDRLLDKLRKEEVGRKAAEEEAEGKKQKIIKKVENARERKKERKKKKKEDEIKRAERIAKGQEEAPPPLPPQLSEETVQRGLKHAYIQGLRNKRSADRKIHEKKQFLGGIQRRGGRGTRRRKRKRRRKTKKKKKRRRRTKKKKKKRRRRTKKRRRK